MPNTQTPRKNYADQNGSALPDNSNGHDNGNAKVSAMASGLDMLGGIDNTQAFDFNNTGTVSSTENNVTPPDVRLGEGEEPIKPTTEEAEYDYANMALDLLANKMKLSDLPPEAIEASKRDDNLIHALSALMVESGNDPKEVEADLHDSLKLLGYDMGELEKRTSAYNRFANGAKDTVASAYAGAGNAIGALTGGALGDESPNTDDISDMVEKDMDETAKADSELYKSLNPQSKYELNYDGLRPRIVATDELTKPTDMATTIGQETPGLVLGGAVSKAPKVGAIAEGLYEGARGMGETKEFSHAQLLAPAVGYGLAKMFANKIGRTFDNIKEYEDAVRAEPALEKQLLEMAEYKGIDIKDIQTGKGFNKVEDYAKHGLRDDGIISEQTIRSYDHSTPEKYYKERKKAFEGGKEIGRDQSKLPEWKFNRLYNAKFPTALAQNSKNFDEFINKVVEYEDTLGSIDMKDLVSWAKNMKKLSAGEKLSALEKIGASGAMGITTGVPGLNAILPDMVNRWMSKSYNAVKKPVVKRLVQPMGDI
jgi:hypothetical protein